MNSELKVPDFFPASVAVCNKVSQDFFDCFTQHSEKTETNDTTAGSIGLSKCHQQMKIYEQCMKENMPKVVKSDKKFRVRTIFNLLFRLHQNV